MTDDLLLILPICTTIIGIGSIALLSGGRRGDLVSPMTTCLALWTAIFGVRPIFLYATEDFTFYGLDTRSGYNLSALIGLCGVVASVCGFLVARTASRDSAVPERSRARDESGSVGIVGAFVLACLVLIGWLTISAALGGGLSFIGQMFEGRAADTNEVFVGVPAIVPALPVVASLVMVVTRIKVERVRPLEFSERVLYWTIVILAVIPPLALGSRRFLIPSVLAGLMGAMTRTWKRRVSPLMVLGGAAVLFLLAVVPFVRSAGSRQNDADLLTAIGDRVQLTGVGGVAQDFFVSYDTEMFDYIAWVAPRLGSGSSSIPYGLGRGTLLEPLLAVLPQANSSAQTWSNELLMTVFGGPCGTVNCPVPSAFGTLYFDWSFPGLIIGAFLAGVLFFSFTRWVRTAVGFKLVAVIAFGVWAPLMARGNFASQLWIALQVTIIVLITLFILDAFYRSQTSSPIRSSAPGAERSRGRAIGRREVGDPAETGSEKPAPDSEASEGGNRRLAAQ